MEFLVVGCAGEESAPDQEMVVPKGTELACVVIEQREELGTDTELVLVTSTMDSKLGFKAEGSVTVNPCTEFVGEGIGIELVAEIGMS